jgi:replication fork clamp-binding protein CrfC
MDSCENLSDEDIGNCIRNAKGPRTSLFVPEAAFEMLVKRQVLILQDPSLRCVDQVFEELVTIVDYCEKDLIRFPNLRERVKEFVINLLRDYTAPCKTYIKDMIDTEQAYINTNHPDFFGGGASAIQLVEKMSSGQQPIPTSQNEDPKMKGKLPPPKPQTQVLYPNTSF